jgi:diaminopimelate decarboxylase
LDGIRYAIHVPGKSGTPTLFVLFGPTCDSVGTLSRNQYLPGDIANGDLVSFNKAGASAECLFSGFHGINPPEVLYLDDDLA